jgi:hypothetical protein
MQCLKTILLFGISIAFIACENDVNEVKALGKKNTGVEEGKNIESLLHPLC